MREFIDMPPLSHDVEMAHHLHWTLVEEEGRPDTEQHLGLCMLQVIFTRFRVSQEYKPVLMQMPQRDPLEVAYRLMRPISRLAVTIGEFISQPNLAPREVADRFETSYQRMYRSRSTMLDIAV